MNTVDTTAGFTLIEMIVSIGIFTIVAVSAAAALTSVIGANSRTQALTETNNNLNFVLQSMVREIRNGFNYGCSADSPQDVGECTSTGGSKEFGFINSARNEIGYELASGRIHKNDNPITPDQVDITHLRFRVIGAEDNNEQSRVEITIQAQSGGGDATSTLNLQTTATQRLLYTPTN